MVERTKKHKKSFISEDDISSLLQRSLTLSLCFYWILVLLIGIEGLYNYICGFLFRYPATTVLALLQEVAHCAEMKMDWNALVKNTSTGISDAREYQMLWRHLAYHHALVQKFEHGAQPLVSQSATFAKFMSTSNLK